ncbi:lipocalin family protein [Cytophaga sp. FL35]|nr:lipocalin family protein [Cytophaga sp. FL35]
MKNSIVLGALFLMLASCSLSKEIREQRDTINGTWILQDVSFEQEGDFKAKLFNDADAFCFEGSSWYFFENNSTGSYTINGNSGACPTGTRNIRWSVQEDPSGANRLQFKYIDEKKNDLYGRTGYGMDIVSLSSGSMTLKSNVNANGEMVSVIYSFNKQ